MRTEVSADRPYADVTDTLEYRARGGERNQLVVRWVEPPDGLIRADGDQRVELLDPAGISPGNRCFRPLRHDRSRAVCLPRGSPGGPGLSIRLGDRADLALVEFWPFGEPTLSGGRGPDRLRASSESGAFFSGGQGSDLLVGGPGDDLFEEGRRASGGDTIRGGEAEPGDFEAEADDFVSYGDRRRPVNADLDGRRDDGERGERDRIGSDVESIIGGRGRDRLAGDGAPNTLVGGRGSDVLRGGEGVDVLSAGNADTAASRLATHDKLFGGRGSDILYGTRGSNVIVGGSGRDDIDAGRGDDRIEARDGEPDVVRCGRGRDRAKLDGSDFFSNRGTPCERVRRAGNAVAVPLVRPVQEGFDDGFPFDTGVISLELGCPSDAGSRCSGEVRVVGLGRVLASSPFELRRGHRRETPVRAHPGSVELVRAAGGGVLATALVSTRDRRGAPRETSVPILVSTNEEEGTAPP